MKKYLLNEPICTCFYYQVSAIPAGCSRGEDKEKDYSYSASIQKNASPRNTKKSKDSRIFSLDFPPLAIYHIRTGGRKGKVALSLHSKGRGGKELPPAGRESLHHRNIETRQTSEDEREVAEPNKLSEWRLRRTISRGKKMQRKRQRTFDTGKGNCETGVQINGKIRIFL